MVSEMSISIWIKFVKYPRRAVRFFGIPHKKPAETWEKTPARSAGSAEKGSGPEGESPGAQNQRTGSRLRPRGTIEIGGGGAAVEEEAGAGDECAPGAHQRLGNAGHLIGGAGPPGTSRGEPPVPRRISPTPGARSRARICREMADWEVQHRSAAPVKLAQSMTAAKCRICFSGKGRSSLSKQMAPCRRGVSKRLSDRPPPPPGCR